MAQQIQQVFCDGWVWQASSILCVCVLFLVGGASAVGVGEDLDPNIFLEALGSTVSGSCHAKVTRNGDQICESPIVASKCCRCLLQKCSQAGEVMLLYRPRDFHWLSGAGPLFVEVGVDDFYGPD